MKQFKFKTIIKFISREGFENETKKGFHESNLALKIMFEIRLFEI